MNLYNIEKNLEDNQHCGINYRVLIDKILLKDNLGQLKIFS
jgi:hypothetical protein